MKIARTFVRTSLSALAALCLLSAPASAAGEAETHSSAAESARQDLEKSLAELSELRSRIAAGKLPLTQKLSGSEKRLTELRREFDDVGKLLDTRNLDISSLTTELKARREEKSYLSNLLEEYVRNLETRVHIAELQRYQKVFEDARVAPEDTNLSSAGTYALQLAAVEASMDRLEEALGGTSFDGKAVDEGGIMTDVRFTLIGPLALFSTADGKSSGLAEQRLGSLEPNMIPLEQPELARGVADIVMHGRGLLPFDPSLGNAQKIEATRESLAEHIAKGGPVMVPILGMAFAALVVAFLKWIQLARVRTPSKRILDSLLDTLKTKDYTGASARISTIGGPTGAMLKAGVEHIREPKALIEEVMFEKMLETRLKLQSFLPFVALCASAAPLLGLLGTVTGMINTFKLITVFGTGDAKTLSSGISEALVTTEFGLIVAIPSLILYAYLSRRSQRLIDGMEKTAISFLNRMSGGGGPIGAAAD
jgi:biopolymer transport protein ExbB